MKLLTGMIFLSSLAALSEGFSVSSSRGLQQLQQRRQLQHKQPQQNQQRWRQAVPTTTRTTKMQAGETPTIAPSRLESLSSNAKQLLFVKGQEVLKDPNLSTNLLSGATVSLAMVPEAVAFAFVCGVNPLVGLWSAVIMGFFTSAFGGRPGMISGASGACAVVMAELVRQHSVAYLAPAVALAGVLQILAGVFKLGKFIRLVPHPVMLGFVNGLAIMVGKAQLRHFRSAGMWLTGVDLASMVGYTGLTMGLIAAAPRVTTAIPASLVSIVAVTLLSKVLPLPLRTLSDMAGAETFRGGVAVLPDVTQLAVPLSAATFKIILPFAIVHGLVGLIESLLTLTLIDGIVRFKLRCSTQTNGSFPHSLSLTRSLTHSLSLSLSLSLTHTHTHTHTLTHSLTHKIRATHD